MSNDQSQENPKIIYAISHAQELLDLLEEILSNDDARLDQDVLTPAKSLAYKLYAHCVTTLRLVQDQEAHIQFAGKVYVDVASVRALIRVCIETYLTLFEVFFEHYNDNTIVDFRFRIWLLKGTAPAQMLREHMSHLMDAQTVASYSDQFEESKRQHEEYKQSIRESDYFRKLKSKERKDTERLLRKPKDYFKIKYADRNREELLAAAGLNGYLLAYIYSDTSSYIHSDGYSAWDSNPFTGNDRADIDGFYLFIPLALVGKTIRNFASLSEHYQEICEKRPDVFRLAGHLSEEIRKGREDDAAPEA